jgi:hypothetical protein
LRVNDDGGLFRGYENDGLPIPTDSHGTIEGQAICRKWPARVAFTRTNRTTEFYQYTDTSAGTFWDATQTGYATNEEFAISIGVPFEDAQWFRGRDTAYRQVSTCPDPTCCKTPTNDLRDRWAGKVWPSARMNPYVLAPLPTGTFPGVDQTEVYEFLERHARAPR